MSILSILTVAALLLAAGGALAKEKTETFDADPQWEGVNNRSATTQEPATIRQDFGWSNTSNAGGDGGEIGGHVSPAGEVAYYAAPIPKATLEDKLTASGKMSVDDGGTHLLLGFFNSGTAKEWRTNNALSLRIHGRGDHFLAYFEYGTQLWKAGGMAFAGKKTPGLKNADAVAWKNAFHFTTKKAIHTWSLHYDPSGNNGGGTITAAIDDQTVVCDMVPGHKAEGATFTHFGIMNVAKSADKGSEFFADDLIVNGRRETFDTDPKWDEKKNRTTYQSPLVRPRFDFGFSPTHFSGGKSKGELGGLIFRGDCRYPARMACYGDKLGPLTLDKPLKASGKIALTRGVTDSTALFGFYNAADSMRQNESQKNSVPESVLGVHIEGPSSEGFLFYPVYRAKGADNVLPPTRQFPPIYPDGKSRDWTLQYDPDSAGGKGRITIMLDGVTKTFDLKEGDKTRGTQFDRFGIVTSWIDGNSQNVYWDDLTYTVAQE